MSTLGERIKYAREEKGLLQNDLAKLIGVKSSGVISNWEKDLNKPDAEKIVKLCNVLDISASFLLDYYGKSTFSFETQEVDHIKKYRDLDDHGKEMVDFVLNREYERAQQPVDGQISLLPIDGYIQIFRNGHWEKYQKVEETDSNVNAAHAINNASEEDKKHDENILDEENF